MLLTGAVKDQSSSQMFDFMMVSHNFNTDVYLTVITYILREKARKKDEEM